MRALHRAQPLNRVRAQGHASLRRPTHSRRPPPARSTAPTTVRDPRGTRAAAALHPAACVWRSPRAARQTPQAAVRQNQKPHRCLVPPAPPLGRPPRPPSGRTRPPRSVSACRRGGPELGRAASRRPSPLLLAERGTTAFPLHLPRVLATASHRGRRLCAPTHPAPRPAAPPAPSGRSLGVHSGGGRRRRASARRASALGTQLTLNLTANALCQVLLAFKESFIPVSQCDDLNPGLQADTSAPHGGRRACARPPPLPLFPSHSRARVLPLSLATPLSRALASARARGRAAARARRRSGG